MVNQEKQILIRDNNTGKEFFMPREGYENAKKNPAYHLWQKIGLQMPNNVQRIWYVNESEKNSALVNGKPFFEGYDTSSYFKITNRIDNTFIEGFLGHQDLATDFFSDIAKDYSYFEDYLLRKKIYFTFDKISLYQLTEIIRDNPIKLILKRINDLPSFKPNTAFMIMPFRDENLNEFYEKNIRKYLKEKLNIEIYTAANFTDNDIIIETIYKSIEQSEFVIADTTQNNKNVFYELGYAVAKEREVITIQNQTEQIYFFDRAHVRSITYSLDNLEKFKADLISTIQVIRSRK